MTTEFGPREGNYSPEDHYQTEVMELMAYAELLTMRVPDEFVEEYEGSESRSVYWIDENQGIHLYKITSQKSGDLKIYRNGINHVDSTRYKVAFRYSPITGLEKDYQDADGRRMVEVQDYERIELLQAFKEAYANDSMVIPCRRGVPSRQND